LNGGDGQQPEADWQSVSGDRAEARRQYERFVGLWESADGAQRKTVEEVKARLAQAAPPTP
jgi:hypothetical protein